MIAAFLPSSATPGALAIAALSTEKNLRVWPLTYKRASTSSGADGNDDPATGIAKSDSLGGVHTVTTHFNVPNTTDIFAIHGQFAYGISLMGEAYRIRLPDAANMSGSSGDLLPRQAFELEKMDSGGSGKSRRSNIMLESIAASDDGKVAVAVSSEGIFYYSNQLPEAMSDAAILRIIGKNASENMQFKAPMKVYTPVISPNGKTPLKSGEAMMVVVSNPRDDDGDADPGYFNVDPTEVFASRWMVPSRGTDCWVCGVRNVSHWAAALEPKKKTVSAEEMSAEKKAKAKAKAKAKMRRERALQRAESSAERRSSSDRASNPETPSHVRSKPSLQSTSKKGSGQKKRLTPSSAARAASTTAVARPSSMGLEANSAMADVDADNDDDNEDDSAEDSPSVSALTIELEHYKKRNIEIKTEWQRRLQGERQLRRKWKQREEEFLEQLNDSLTKLDTAEVEVDRLRVLLRDAEKRFAFEKARAEQENSVKARYTQLCEEMNDKMALVADQKRLLEQTTRSLLTEVDRNVHALKNAVVLEKNECVVCRDRQSVTAVVPCGHLCFCEQDGETYRRNCPSENPTCPICQQEIVSLLRIY
ncbi:hypothetical protein BBJ28_00021732 [Nothophytophthora sp. Chile5]|nr:hypothetical protein BBJ28_00021732 [Nothophytophthora sp. Chile5]